MELNKKGSEQIDVECDAMISLANVPVKTTWITGFPLFFLPSSWRKALKRLFVCLAESACLDNLNTGSYVQVQVDPESKEYMCLLIP